MVAKSYSCICRKNKTMMVKHISKITIFWRNWKELDAFYVETFAVKAKYSEKCPHLEWAERNKLLVTTKEKSSKKSKKVVRLKEMCRKMTKRKSNCVNDESADLIHFSFLDFWC